MITNRLYAGLFGGSFLACVVLAVAVSGGDLAFVGFFSGITVLTIGLVAGISLPMARVINGWRRRALGALAERVGGTLVLTVGGDPHLRLPEPDGATVVFFVETAETPGGAEDRPGTPWTAVGRLRPGRNAPAVEVRLLPDGARAVRWTNRWWDVFPRRAPVDPLRGPAAHAAADALAALVPGAESRLSYAADLVAFLAPGRCTDPDALAALLAAARPHLRALD